MMKFHFPVCPIHWCHIGASTEASLRQLIWALGSFRHPEPCNSYTAHCTLNTALCALHTVHCTRITEHCTLHTIYLDGKMSIPLHTEQYTLNWYRRSIQNIHLNCFPYCWLILGTCHISLHTETCSLNYANCLLHNVHCTLVAVNGTTHTKQYTFHTLNCTTHSPHIKWHSAHCTQPTAHCTLHICPAYN